MKIAFVCVGDRPYAKYPVASFKKYLPQATVVQITDHVTPKVEGVDEVIRSDYDGKNLMLFLIKGFRDIEFDDILITTADDCLLSHDLSDELYRDYDVAIVKRHPYQAMSSVGKGLLKFKYEFNYTNGIVIVKNKQFYKDCYDMLLTMEDRVYSDRKYWEWWGDMACITEVIKTKKYKIRLLSEYDYCYKPEFLGDPGNRAVRMWHYSGKRKHWMKYHPK